MSQGFGLMCLLTRKEGREKSIGLGSTDIDKPSVTDVISRLGCISGRVVQLYRAKCIVENDRGHESWKMKPRSTEKDLLTTT